MATVPKKSKLKAVDPKSAEPAKPKMLIFGKPGVGKTWTSLDFPNVYFIDTEGGANLERYTNKLKASGGVYFGPEHGSQDFDTVISQVEALATEEHSYKTVVIDSITKLYNIEITKEGVKLGDKNGFGADKKPAIAYVRRLINWLDRLDMNVILVSHEKAQWSGGAEVGVTFDCYDKLEYELHLCLNITKEAGKRTARIRKSRLESFPDGESFPWSYAEFAARYGKEIIEKQVKAIVLADEAQLTEVKQLVELYKIEKEKIDKWFTCAKVEKWEEMDADKVVGIISFLKKTYTPQPEKVA